MLNRKFILDIGCGKFDPTLFPTTVEVPTMYLHVDRCVSDTETYMCHSDGEKVRRFYSTTMEEVSFIYKQFSSNGDFPTESVLHIFCKSDIFEFMEKFNYKFDAIIANRIFEHLDYASGKIGYMIELCNMITNPGGELTILVPDHLKLSKMLVECENKKLYTNHDRLLINTEFCNSVYDPHLSIWTPELAKQYIGDEGTWDITSIQNKSFAGRDIYLEIVCKNKK